MKSIVKRLVKRAFNSVGVDIVRMQRSPRISLLGLRHYPFRSIIDIGANRGQFARYISTLFPDAHIYCFEPLPGAFRELSKWAKNEKVTAVNFALGDREGTFELSEHIDHSLSSSFLRTTKLCETLYPITKRKKSIQVNITTLDKWIESLATPLIPEILIKLDVQGYEDRVLQGGRKTFNIAKACILEICLDKLYQDQATFKDIFFLLNDLGYHYAGNLAQHYADNGHIIYIDTIFEK
jgi:FkbM family methyltransferase